MVLLASVLGAMGRDAKVIGHSVKILIYDNNNKMLHTEMLDSSSEAGTTTMFYG